MCSRLSRWTMLWQWSSTSERCRTWTTRVVVFGCSGGGDLALQIPTRTKVCAIVAEEPATMVTAGMFNNRLPKKGERYTPDDSFFMMENPKEHYTPEFQEIPRAKIAKITCPILIVQGDADRRERP